MGILGGRSVGRGSPPLRLQDPFSCSSFSLSDSNSPSPAIPVVHQGNHVERRSVRLGCEESCRTCSFDSGLLQPTVCYPQGHRWLAPGYLSLASQLLRAGLSFSLETAQSVLQSPHPGDWLVSLDLQVPLHPSSRHYLRFCLGDSVLQFCSLCFGLSTAPQVFMRVMAPISSVMYRYEF